MGFYNHYIKVKYLQHTGLYCIVFNKSIKAAADHMVPQSLTNAFTGTLIDTC